MLFLLSNASGFTCATNMPPPGREVQAERLCTLPAYRVRCKPSLASEPRDPQLVSAGEDQPQESSFEIGRLPVQITVRCDKVQAGDPS